MNQVFKQGDRVRRIDSPMTLTVHVVSRSLRDDGSQDFTTLGSSVWYRSNDFELVEKADLINHPEHYKSASGIECIDVVESMTFNRGNAIKYLWRAGEKGGPDKEIEDLRKAAWYVQREIERIAAKSVKEAKK